MSALMHTLPVGIATLEVNNISSEIDMQLYDHHHFDIKSMNHISTWPKFHIDTIDHRTSA